MMKTLKNCNAAIILLVGVIVIYFGLIAISENNVQPAIVSMSEEYYEIDPDVIFMSLSDGDTGALFTSISEKPTTTSPLKTNNPVRWRQLDYYNIIQVLAKHVWSESSDWRLEHMFFRLDCADANNGPQMASFRFYQVSGNRRDSARYQRDISVQPIINTIIVREVEFSGNDKGEQSVEIEKIAVPVEEALQIAEQNGGSEFRLEVNNRCAIDLMITGNKHSNWSVSYGDESGRLFEMAIDPMTGLVEIE